VSAQQLAEIEARLNAATPGPWRAANPEPYRVVSDTSAGLWGICDMREGLNGRNAGRDLDFIAHAPSDVAVLVEAVKALRAALEPFAQAAMAYSLELAHPDSEEIETVAEPELTVGDLRRAAAVLGTP